MNGTLTLSLSAKSSVLESQYFPPIENSKDKNYVLGLVELLTFNSIPNIVLRNNKFYIIDKDRIEIPPGRYEIEDIEKYLKKRLTAEKVVLKLKPNNNTLRSIIKCSHSFDFSPQDSLEHLLGFNREILKADKQHTSKHPVGILKVNSLRV